MRSLAIAAAFAAVTCLCAPAAHTQSLAPPFTHEGLFLRAQGGVGYLNAQATFDGATATAKGGAGMLGFAVGGAIAPNLILYGEIWGIAAPSPSIQIGSSTTQANNSTLNYGGIGPGIGYFFMPVNVFLGVSLDFTRLGITNNSNGDQSNSDIGLAASVMLGKQWWFTDQWGLGLSLQVIGGGNRDNNNDNNSATYKTFTGLGLFTLTYG